MVSDKPGVQRLVQICKAKGITDVVFSPGSRNSPLVITFADDPHFNCITIPDERVAGFFAMGMALQLRRPVIICCTSGSAALNYAPAIVEAYYQNIPLLVITADRPVEKIDQGAGQTMRQKNVYANYIKVSYELTQEAESEQDLHANDRLISEAIDNCTSETDGPVHINFPLKEPLYDQVAYYDIEDLDMTRSINNELAITAEVSLKMKEEWMSYPKKLIIFGQSMPSEAIQLAVEAVADRSDIAIISETTSNINGSDVNPCIDRMITTFSEEEATACIPDLIISLGGAIVSKKIKSLFIKLKPKAHWYVSEQEQPQDTYESLTMHVQTSALQFLRMIKKFPEHGAANYQRLWTNHHEKTSQSHDKFLDDCPWSDMLSFHHILQRIPSRSDLHLSNSSPIRYTQLFNQRDDIQYYCNRGVSGIDGCTSTAAGAGHASQNLTTIVTGDLAFMYDSNALWNQYLGGQLRIIIINNGGGGIFKIIPGPASTDQYKEFFATEQSYTAEHIAKTFYCSYQQAKDETELLKGLDWLYSTSFDKPAILEVMTMKVDNEVILGNYFEFMKADKSG